MHYMIPSFTSLPEFRFPAWTLGSAMFPPLHRRKSILALLLIMIVFASLTSSSLFSRFNRDFKANNKVSKNSLPHKLKNRGDKLFAKALSKNGDLVEAAHCFEAAMQLTSGEGGASTGELRLNSCLALARCQFKDKQYEYAIAKCTQVINEISPEDQQKPSFAQLSTDVYLQRGRCWKELEYVNLAYTDARRAAKYAKQTSEKENISQFIKSLDLLDVSSSGTNTDTGTSKLLSKAKKQSKVDKASLKESMRRKNAILLQELTEEFSDEYQALEYSPEDIQMLIKGKICKKQRPGRHQHHKQEEPQQHQKQQSFFGGLFGSNSNSISNSVSSSSNGDSGVDMAQMMNMAGPLLGIDSTAMSRIQTAMSVWNTMRKVVHHSKNIALVSILTYWSYVGLASMRSIM